MSTELQARLLEYGRALAEFLENPEREEACLSAYDFGRRALASGVGLLELATLHHEAVASLLSNAPSQSTAESLSTAKLFFIEALAPFEMSRRLVDEANATLRRLNETLEDGAKRIALSLHDEAGGIIAAARIQLDLAIQDSPNADAKRFEEVRKLLDETGERLRHLSHELRPAILDDLGLAKALSFLAQGISNRSTVKVTVFGELRDRPPARVELALYRVVQEAVNNAIRHASGISTISVRLRDKRNSVVCSIKNDGVGFDVDKTLSDKKRQGLGLLGMRERVHSIGGSIAIRSAPDEGTTIEVVVPLEK
ncbi:MAG TPA: ATP-binding protein [Gammaproteobacteria bacterium]|nr:ATP-binding protein [Gammaproteobacteria bacterium]